VVHNCAPVPDKPDKMIEQRQRLPWTRHEDKIKRQAQRLGYKLVPLEQKPAA
jgi:hypothetical protein